MYRNLKKMLLIFVFSIFIMGVHNVNAALDFNESVICGSEVTDSDGRKYQNCEIGFLVTGISYDMEEFTINFTSLTNVTIEQVASTALGWSMKSSGGNAYVFKNGNGPVTVGRHTIGTFRAYKIEASEKCYFQYNVSVEKVNRSCSIFDGNYYGKNGNIVNELTYQKECISHYCEVLSDGTKYGKDGSIVSDLDYQKQDMAKMVML